MTSCNIYISHVKSMFCVVSAHHIIHMHTHPGCTGIAFCESGTAGELLLLINWLFITNIKGTFLGGSKEPALCPSLEIHQKGAETATGEPFDSPSNPKQPK